MVEQKRELDEMRRIRNAGEWFDVGSARWAWVVIEVRTAIFCWGE